MKKPRVIKCWECKGGGWKYCVPCTRCYGTGRLISFRKKVVFKKDKNGKILVVKNGVVVGAQG